MDAGEIVNEFCAAWNRGDVEAIMDAFSEDAVYHNIPMAPMEGKDAIRVFVGGFFGGMASGVDFEVKHQVVQGNIVMNERVDTIHMAKGPVALPVMGVFEITEDGKIAGWRDYFDMAQFAGG